MVKDGVPVRWWQRLSVKIPVFVMLISLGPLVIFGINTIKETDFNLRAQIGKHAHAVARYAAQTAEALVRGSIEKIQIVINTADLDPRSADDRMRLLHLLRQYVPEVHAFSIMDGQGSVTAHADREKTWQEDEPGNRRNDPFFIRAMRGKVGLGEVKTDSGGVQRLPIFMPLYAPKGGTVIGVLAAELPVRNLLAAITTRKMGDCGSLFVLDYHGRLIGHPDLNRVLAGENHSINPIFRRLMEDVDGGDEALHTRVDETGTELLTTGSKSDFPGWVFMVEQPATEALAPVFTMKRKLGLLLLFIAFSVVGVSVYSLFRLTLPLRHLQHAAQQIENGELGHMVHIASRDEMGEVASTFNAMSRSVQEGSVVRSRTNWIKNGIARINDIMRGKQAVEEVSEAVLTEMATYIGAEVGAFYLALQEDGKDLLRLAAGYALHRSDAVFFERGEGLVGQVLLDRAPIVVRHVPEGYLDVSSGLGDAAPVNILIVPFVYEEQVRGVVELGTLSTETELELEYLSSAAPAVAAALVTTQGRQALSQALERSQAATEALQVQQEELRAANEELEEQRQALKASEEQLRMQQEELQAANEELEEKAEVLERRLG